MTEQQKQVLLSILEDHMYNVERDGNDDTTKHNLEYLKELYKTLDQ